ncbi:MAG: NAD(P)-binding domain-containing protein [Hyphomicrobiaceae bacterium]
MTTPGHDNEEIDRWLSAFSAALDRQDIPAVTALFDPHECFWRDIVAFTWNIVTLDGRDAIAAMLRDRLADVLPVSITRIGGAESVEGAIEARITIETRLGHGEGYVRLKDGKCWTLLTPLAALEAYPEKAGRRRIKGTQHGVHRDRKTWLEERQEDAETLGYSRQPYCVIVGGGQGGIALGARLKRLGVPTLILERNARAGDSWRRRYKSLCLHDPVWYDHLPYIPFPDHWPVFSPKDKLGDWLESYVKVMELDYWTSTTCQQASFDEASGEWSVVVNRNGQRVTLRPRQLILATGMSGVPVVPELPGRDVFKGRQCHSSAFASGEPYKGQRCVVVGSNNSAHDIAADLWEHGADVTMVQRSPTIVARSETLMELAIGQLYSEDALARGITTEMADLRIASMPYRIAPRRNIRLYDEIRKRDHDLYERLEKAGFLFHFGADGSGIHTSYIRRGSGYYIDVGASDLVADGKIKLKSRVEVARLTESGIVLTDGTELPADLVVYATGYGSMNGWAADLISPEVADKVGKCWGVGSATAGDPGPWEGELRNMWKPTAQEGLWFHGGNLFQSRLYSLFLALQLKARYEGLPTPVYGRPPVYHKS